MTKLCVWLGVREVAAAVNVNIGLIESLEHATPCVHVWLRFKILLTVVQALKLLE